MHERNFIRIPFFQLVSNCAQTSFAVLCLLCANRVYRNSKAYFRAAVLLLAGVGLVDTARRPLLFVCIYVYIYGEHPGCGRLHWLQWKGKGEEVDGYIVFHSMRVQGGGGVRLGHDDVSSLKIECQPRKRCHNIPRVCNPGFYRISFLPFFRAPLSCASPVFENVYRREGRDRRAFIFIGCVYSSWRWTEKRGRGVDYEEK